MLSSGTGQAGGAGVTRPGSSLQAGRSRWWQWTNILAPSPLGKHTVSRHALQRCGSLAPWETHSEDMLFRGVAPSPLGKHTVKTCSSEVSPEVPRDSGPSLPSVSPLGILFLFIYKNVLNVYLVALAPSYGTSDPRSSLQHAGSLVAAFGVFSRGMMGLLVGTCRI